MSEQEKYIADQKNCGIEVGDEAVAVRLPKAHEHGWGTCEAYGVKIGDSGIVTAIHDEYGYQLGNNGAWWPYFVLEIVKKANGTVPDAKPIDKGDSNMKNKKYDCEAVSETTDKNGKITNKTIVKRYSFFATDDTDARETVLMDHGEAIKAHRKVGEVEIICRPFCG